MSERKTAFELDTADGYRIAARHFEVAGPAPRAVAIIASAMGVQQEFYASFAAWLADQGIAAYTFDYRGMGASRPPGRGLSVSLKGFHADILDWARLDCAALIEAAGERYPGVPLLWIGHSVGAQILGMIPQLDRLHGMLSIAAGSGYWRHNASPLRYYVLAIWYLIMPLGIRVAGYFPGARMRVVGDLPRGVAEQWRKWCLHAEYLGAEGALLKEQLSRVSTPICALSMQDDEMMTLAGTHALFALYPNAKLELRRVRPSDFGVPAIGHFGFFRTKMRETLWPIATAWIDRTIGQPALPAA